MQIVVLTWDTGHQKIFTKIQSLCHNDTNVQPGSHEQLATSSWQQFVANRTNKLQLQYPFITLSKRSIGDKWSGTIFISESLM